MRELWDKWGWAVALVVISIFVLRMFLGRGAFCGPESEQCFREWVSALGGWVAVGAAVPTIIFLSKQISDTKAHHRETMRRQVQRPYAVAERAERVIHRAQSSCNLIRILIEESRPRFDIEDLAKRYRELMQTLRSSELVAFENEFAPPGGDDIQGLLQQLVEGENSIEEMGLIHAPNALLIEFPKQLEFLGFIIGWVEKYLDECRAIIETATAEYESLGGRPSK